MSTARASAVDRWTIRPVQTIDEYHECERIQRGAWNFDTDLDVIPLTQLVAAQKAGGLVLGAFDEDGGLRGFCYGFLGRDASGRLLHYSHMTAVEPELRSAGLGGRLKWAQRQAVLDQGVELMMWTFDPLESLNAYFNFSKLGVIADTYWKNLYGATGSELHRGTPTDRFCARWLLDSPRVRRRADGIIGEDATRLAREPDAVPSVLSASRAGSAISPVEPRLHLADDLLSCEIPGSIQEVKRARPELGLAWRLATRKALTHYLSRGWIVRECVRTEEKAPRTLYLLDRRGSED